MWCKGKKDEEKSEMRTESSNAPGNSDAAADAAADANAKPGKRNQAAEGGIPIGRAHVFQGCDVCRAVSVDSTPLDLVSAASCQCYQR